MKALRKFGTLGVAMIVAVAGLMLGATPAYAAGYTHYENLGNPGWCMDGNGTDAYLHRCGHGDVDYQLWLVTQDADNLQLVHAVSGDCLTALSTGNVALRTCGEAGSFWDARGKNGWVKLISYSNGCLAPFGTGVGGRSTYPLVVAYCEPYPNDPYQIVNVPNLFAWRWH